MATVSQGEWLRRETGQAEREDLDADLGEHMSDGPREHRSPASRGRNALQRRPGGTGQLQRGHPGSDVPSYPAPLPSDGHRVDHAADAVRPHAPLDVGPAKPAYSGMMAHGVEAPVHYGGRPAPTPEQRTEHEASARPAKEPPGPAGTMHPVPVFIVPEGAGNRPLAVSALRQVPVVPAGQQPEQVVGRNPRRTRVRLLNESATAIRILTGPVSGGGAMLPASMTQYQDVETQDVIYAVADSGEDTLYLSVIDEYSVPGGA